MTWAKCNLCHQESHGAISYGHEGIAYVYCEPCKHSFPVREYEVENDIAPYDPLDAVDDYDFWCDHESVDDLGDCFRCGMNVRNVRF